jgi:transposase-like protein
MKIGIESGEQAKELIRELLFTLSELRYWMDQWGKHYGSDFLRERRKCEKRADDILKKLNMEERIVKSEIEIEIEK